MDLYLEIGVPPLSEEFPEVRILQLLRRHCLQFQQGGLGGVYVDCHHVLGPLRTVFK